MPSADSRPSPNQHNIARSTLVSRNVTIGGHRTSVRLEPDMWTGLMEICRRERASLHQLCTLVAGRKKDNTSLTAAIRVFVMTYFRAAATEDGHTKAGHGYGAMFSLGESFPLPRMIPPAAAVANGKMAAGHRA